MTVSRLPTWHPVYLIATWFGVGRLPLAPGTWASLVTLPIGWHSATWLGPRWLFATVVIIFVVGWWAADVYAHRNDMEDPAEVVVDEVAGQLVVLAVVPIDLTYYAAAFVLFRIADIWKPWPISFAEQRLGGGLGIMADDILAGGYAAIVLLAAIQVLT
ncbi:MAG: phosphatidylglycerophosphatase A [Rhodospirillales bacterium]